MPLSVRAATSHCALPWSIQCLAYLGGFLKLPWALAEPKDIKQSNAFDCVSMRVIGKKNKEKKKSRIALGHGDALAVGGRTVGRTVVDGWMDGWHNIPASASRLSCPDLSTSTCSYLPCQDLLLTGYFSSPASGGALWPMYPCTSMYPGSLCPILAAPRCSFTWDPGAWDPHHVSCWPWLGCHLRCGPSSSSHMLAMVKVLVIHCTCARKPELHSRPLRK